MKSRIFHLLNRDWALGFVLLGLTFAVYKPAWNGKPIWDDDHHITRPDLRSMDGLWRIWIQLGATQQYYPIVHSVFWMEYHLWGDSTFGYHLINILLHFFSALLLVCILRRLAIPGAWFIAAIFALHPVQVESVAWITELKNTLSGVFFFATVLVYLKFDSERRMKYYIIAIGFFILGLMSKSVIATLPLSLLIVFWWKRGRINWKLELVPLLPFFVVGIISGLFTAWVEHKVVGAQGSAYAFTFIERCLIAGRAIYFYLGKIFLPTDLIFIYPRWNISQAIWWQYLFPAAILILAGVLWKLRSFSRAPLAAFLYFMASLFPVLGFFNVYPFRYSFVADHFQYLACIGPIVLATAGIKSAIESINENQRRFLKSSLYGIVLLTLCVLTWKQCRMFVDAETLFRMIIKKNPACWMAYNNLGNVLYLAGKTDLAMSNYQKSLEIKPINEEAHYNLGNALLKIGRTDDAIIHYRKSLEIKSDFSGAWNNLGNALLKSGQNNGALSCYQKALEINPNYTESHTNLGVLLAKNGQTEEAIAHYRKALQINPNYAEAHYNLGNILLKIGRTYEAIIQYQRALETKPNDDQTHCSLGILLAENGRTDEAMIHFQKAIEIRPDNDEAHYNLGILLAENDQINEAIAHYQKAIEINPNYAEAHNNLGVLLVKSGQTDEAIAHYEKALQNNPDYADCHNNLGNALFQIGRIDNAIEHYREALKINPNKISALKNLAIVYVRMGKLTDAVPLVEKALAVAKAAGDEPMVREITANLDQLIKMSRLAKQVPR